MLLIREPQGLGFRWARLESTFPPARSLGGAREAREGTGGATVTAGARPQEWQWDGDASEPLLARGVRVALWARIPDDYFTRPHPTLGPYKPREFSGLDP